MPFEDCIWTGQRSRSCGFDGMSLDNLLFFYVFFFPSTLGDKDCLAVLRLVQEKGNVTTYEWKYGTKPEHVEETKCTIDTSDEKEEDIVQDVVEDVRYTIANLSYAYSKEMFSGEICWNQLVCLSSHRFVWLYFHLFTKC